MNDEDNPCIITIVITKATLARLQLIAGERGETEGFVWQLASDAVDEAALNAFRGRDDDPGRGL